MSSKKILISGSTGLVGSALAKRLKELGYTVLPLSVSQFEGGILWNPMRRVFSTPIYEQMHAIIHLGGAPIKFRWNARMKFDMMESRVNGANLLCQLILHNPPPETFICASSIGYYGTPPSNFKGEGFTESSQPYPFKDEQNKPFLHELANEIESACDAVRDVTRVVNPRLAQVLDPERGVLPKFMAPFKIGLGGPWGTGEQDFSWVSLRDAVDAYVFALECKDVSGPVNVASPTATTQKDFAHALGKAMGRPSSFSMPAPLLKALLGSEAAESMLLASTRIIPKVLQDKGFTFHDKDIEPFLMDVLKRGH